jgi:hypothetical protein
MTSPVRYRPPKATVVWSHTGLSAPGQQPGGLSMPVSRVNSYGQSLDRMSEIVAVPIPRT